MILSKRPSAIINLCFTILALAIAGCEAKLPDNATKSDSVPDIYPDYNGVTVPVNIAPLNFTINDEAESYISYLHGKNGDGIVVEGKTVNIPIKKWNQLLAANYGGNIDIDVYMKRDGVWSQFSPLTIAVADSIDNYISYRQLEPSYVNFEEMRICERNLENFDERVILCNQSLTEGDNGQCINCHSYQDYNRTGNMQMHVRVNHGGTVIVNDGKARKVNLKRPETLSAGVYPSWHPTLPLIAYSNNTTGQNFHSRKANKVEVQDNESDLILYDVNQDKVMIIANDSTQLESFPYWNHDGTSLYYVSASLPDTITEADIPHYKTAHYRDYKYNIYRKPFDAATLTFGASDTILNASALGKSAILPRESPDGRYLLFAMAEYGTFHIWHHDADLYLIDLTTGEMSPLDEVNSADTESYHSWSSNGRWIIFSSRRDDGNYTRLYIAYFDKDGKAGKPFLLPQSDPAYNQQLYKSYNIPEFMVAPAVDRTILIDAINQ